MKNTEVSRKVLKAITIGLAAAMAMMPTVTAFADDGEGGGDSGSSSHSESSDSGSHDSGSHDSDSHDSDSHEDHSEHTDDVESSHDDVEDAADEVRDEEGGGDESGDDGESGGGEESYDDGGSEESYDGGGEESYDGGSEESYDGGGEESYDGGGEAFDGGSGESTGGGEAFDGGSGESAGGGEEAAGGEAAGDESVNVPEIIGASGDEAVNVPEITGASGDEAVNVPELLGASPTDATEVIDNEIKNEAGAIGVEESSGTQAGTGEETGGYQSVSGPLSDAAGSLNNIVEASGAVDTAFADAAKKDKAAVDAAQEVEDNEFLAVFNDWTMPSAENAVKTADTEVNTNIGVTVKQDVSEAASAGYENEDAADTAKTEAQTQLDKAVEEANNAIKVAKTDLGSAQQALDNAESQLKEAQDAKKEADDALNDAKENFRDLLKANGISATEEGDTIKAVGDISKLDGDIKAAIDSAAKAVENAKSNAEKAADAVEKAKENVDIADENYSQAGVNAVKTLAKNSEAITEAYNTAKSESETAASEVSTAEGAKTQAENDLTSAQNNYDTALATHQETYDEAHASIYETIDSKLTNVEDDWGKNRALAFYFAKLYLIDNEDAEAESIEVDKDNQPSIDKKTGIVTSIGKKIDGGITVNYTTKSGEQKSLIFNWMKYDAQGTPNDKLSNDYDTYKVVLVENGKDTDTVLGEVKLDRDDSKTVTGKSITVGDSEDKKLDLIGYLDGYNTSKTNLQNLSDEITKAEGKVTEAGNKLDEANARFNEVNTSFTAAEAAYKAVEAMNDLNINADTIREILAGSKGEDETDEDYKARVQKAYDDAKASAEKANTGYEAISNSYNVLSSLIDQIKSQQETVGNVKVKEGNNIQESYKEFRELASLLTQYKLMQELKEQGVDLSTVTMDVRRNSDGSVWWRTGQGSENNYGEITYKIGDVTKKFYFDYLALDENGEHVLDHSGLKNTSIVKNIVVVSNTDADGQLSLGGKFDEGSRYIDENAYQSMFDDLNTDLSYAKAVKEYAAAVVEYGKMMKIQKTAEYAQQRVNDAAEALVNASYDQSVSTAKIKQLKDEFAKAQQKYNDANTKYEEVKGDLENLKAEIDKIIESGFKVKSASTDNTPVIGDNDPSDSDSGSGNGSGGDSVAPPAGGGESTTTTTTSTRTRTRSRSGGGDDAASEVDGPAAADTGAPAADAGATGVAAAETAAPGTPVAVTTYTRTADGAFTDAGAPAAIGETVTLEAGGGAVDGGAVDGGAVLEDGGAPAGEVLGDAAAPAGAVEEAAGGLTSEVLGDRANPVAQVLGERLAPIVDAVENGTFDRSMVLNDDVKGSIPFGWWLLILILGATGVKMYMDHRKRKEEEAAKRGR